MWVRFVWVKLEQRNSECPRNAFRTFETRSEPLGRVPNIISIQRAPGTHKYGRRSGSFLPQSCAKKKHFILVMTPPPRSLETRTSKRGMLLLKSTRVALILAPENVFLEARGICARMHFGRVQREWTRKLPTGLISCSHLRTTRYRSHPLCRSTSGGAATTRSWKGSWDIIAKI